MAIGGLPHLPGYAVLRRLGEGASGSVLLARHEETGQLAAIKVLSPALTQDPRFLAQFRAEAEILRSLRHPNITTLYWYAETGDGALLAMQAIDGAALRHLVESGPTSPEAALLALRGSLDALEHAHAVGIVHRDYKPENVLVDREGESHLVDFGIAVPTGGGQLRAGTPAYMAPEQWAGGEATPATDVYAAGVVLFECLAGRRPFAGGDLEALRAQHESMEAPIEAVPELLRDLVRRGMAKDAAARHPSAGHFLEQLEVAAVAAYGPEWSRRGALALAGAAVGALAAAVPFLLASGSATGAGGVATVAQASVSGGGGSAGAPAAGAAHHIGTLTAGTSGTPASTSAAPTQPALPAQPAAATHVAPAQPHVPGSGAPTPPAAGPPHPGVTSSPRGPRRIPRPRPAVAAAGIGAVVLAAVAGVIVATRGGTTTAPPASPLPASAVTVTAALNPGDGSYSPPGSASLSDPTILPAAGGDVVEVLTILEPLDVALGFAFCDPLTCGTSENAECTAALYIPGFGGALPMSLDVPPPPGSHPMRMQITGGPAPGAPMTVAAGSPQDAGTAGGVLVSSPAVGGDGTISMQFNSPIRKEVLAHMNPHFPGRVCGFTAADRTAFQAAHGSKLHLGTGAVRIVVEWSPPSAQPTKQQVVLDGNKKDLVWKQSATQPGLPAPPVLRQDDPRWAQTAAGSTTLAASGNVPTAVAAMLTALGTQVDPPAVAQELVTSGAWKPGKGTDWTALSGYLQSKRLAVADTTLLAATQPGSGAEYLVALDGRSAGSGSVVLVTAYDAATDRFTVIDPAAGQVQVAFDDMAAANPWVFAVSTSPPA